MVEDNQDMACSSQSQSQLMSSSLSSDSCNDTTSSPSSTSLLDRLRAPQVGSHEEKKGTHTCGKHISAIHSRKQAAIQSLLLLLKELRSLRSLRMSHLLCLLVLSCLLSFCKLFCLACREELGLKKSVIDRHVRLSKKHPEAKKNLLEKQQREQDIAEKLQEYNSQEHTSGESLPINQQVYRIKVVSTFLRAGVPLAKIELFLPILEDTGYRLSGRRGMSDLIPFIHQQEQSKIKEEIEGMKVGVIQCFSQLYNISSQFDYLYQKLGAKHNYYLKKNQYSKEESMHEDSTLFNIFIKC